MDHSAPFLRRIISKQESARQPDWSLKFQAIRSKGASQPDTESAVLDTGLQWPADVVSLGHVALPFRPVDPAYGFMSGSGRDDIPSIGSWLLRGENGAIAISLGALTRLRSNPFWSLIAADTDGFVTEDLAVESVAN